MKYTWTKCLTPYVEVALSGLCHKEARCLSGCTLFPLFSLLSRSEDKTELQGSSPASGEDADKTLPEYSKELETLCEELQTTLEALVRSRAPGTWARSRRTSVGGCGGGLGTFSAPGRYAHGGRRCPPDTCLSLLSLLHLPPKSQCPPGCCPRPLFFLPRVLSGSISPTSEGSAW